MRSAFSGNAALLNWPGAHAAHTGFDDDMDRAT
jgi:hypothetical protein